MLKPLSNYVYCNVILQWLKRTHVLFNADLSILQLPKDMENYMEYNIMGSVSAIRMKPSCLPSRFECQPDRLKRAAKSMPRSVAVKRQCASLIQEILVQTETEAVDTPSTSNIESQHSNMGIGGNSIVKAVLL